MLVNDGRDSTIRFQLAITPSRADCVFVETGLDGNDVKYSLRRRLFFAGAECVCLLNVKD